jgi:hypothetical protein
MELKLKTHHWGFQILAKDQADQAKLDAWMDTDVLPTITELQLEDVGTRELIAVDPNETNGERARKFCRDAMQKFLEYDAVFGLWLDGRDYCLLRPLEYFLYSDMLGVETVKYVHNLSLYQIEMLPKEQQQRFLGHPHVFLNPNFGEHWKLAKRTPTGDGLGIPWLMTIFMILGEEESKENGIYFMAWLTRTANRAHNIGHEIKSGPYAGRENSDGRASWTKEKSDEIIRAWKDTVGANDVTRNFDITTEFPWPPMEYFDETLWNGSRKRLTEAFGPLAMMAQATGVTPFLSAQAKAIANFDRNEIMAPFMSQIIRKAYKCPVPVRLVWQDDIFTTDQLNHELRKFVTMQGNVSPDTQQGWAGLDPKQENEKKLAAVNHPDAQALHMPIYDSAHGGSPAIDGPIDTNPPVAPIAPGASKKPKGQKPGSKAGTPKGRTHKS